MGWSIIARILKCLNYALAQFFCNIHKNKMENLKLVLGKSNFLSQGQVKISQSLTLVRIVISY
jgi:hypothetical protein